MNGEQPYPGLTVTLSPEVQRDSGYLFFVAAKNYLAAAEKCCDGLLKPNDLIHSPEWTVLHDPVLNLFCHAIELMLKGYLIANGIPEMALAKNYGHDLAKLEREARALGLRLDQDQVESIEYLASEYGKQPYRFRYPGLEGRSLSFFDQVLALVKQIGQATYPSVVRKARSMGIPIDGNEEGFDAAPRKEG